jgi:hypothetical protein
MGIKNECLPNIEGRWPMLNDVGLKSAKYGTSEFENGNAFVLDYEDYH